MGLTAEQAQWRANLLKYHAETLVDTVEAEAKLAEADLWVTITALEAEYIAAKQGNDPQKTANLRDELQGLRAYWRGIWQFTHDQGDATGYAKVLDNFTEGGI